MDRREFIRRTSLVVVFGAIGSLAFFEALAKFEAPSPMAVPQTIGGAPQTVTQTQGLQPPAGYIYLAPLSAVSGKTSAYFNHPTGGSSILVDFGGQWRAFGALCTHAGCAVNFTGSSIFCPCHAGYFSPTDGSVTGGPPTTPLPEYGVVVQGGSLYVSQNRI